MKNHANQAAPPPTAAADTRLPFQNAKASRIALNLAAVVEFDRRGGTPADAFEACLARGARACS